MKLAETMTSKCPVFVFTDTNLPYWLMLQLI